MACKDCLKNCGDLIAADKCVTYTGPDIPLLGICTGDSLLEWETAIADQLLASLDGTGITPSDVSIDCTFLSDILGALPPNLNNLLQMLITASCTLKELVDTINEQIANAPSFDASCLDVPSDATRDQILQAVVTLLCSIKTTVDAIPTTYVQLTDLTTLVTNIFNTLIGGGGSVSQQNAKMVPFVAYEYYGPLSNFDSGGIGQTSLGFEKVYICNGSNGTPDRRGRIGVGAIRSVPGGSLDPAVDPTVSANNPNWAINDKAGETFHLLLTSEMPTHSHSITDPGHTHTVTYGLDEGGNRFGANWMKHDGNNASRQTLTSTTGITINSAGGNQPHNNIQPSIAALYIMYIP